MPLDDAHDRAADDDAIGGTAHFGGLVGSGNAESDRDRDPGVGLDRRDVAGDALGEGGLGSGDAFARDVVDEPFGRGSQFRDAVGRSGRGDQADVAEGSALGELAVEDGFVGREIEEQDPVGPGRGGVLVELRESVAVDRIEVGEEHHGSLRAFAEAADQVEDLVSRRPGFEGAVGGHLVDDAVGQGVGERQAELDDVGSLVSEGLDDLQRAVEVRIAGGDIGDKGLFPFGTEAGERGVDSVHERRQPCESFRRSPAARRAVCGRCRDFVKTFTNPVDYCRSLRRFVIVLFSFFCLEMR